MKTNLYSAAALFALAWATAALSGCCWGKNDPCAACYPASFGCFGYHSTCWRPWPEECPTCPSYAIMPPPQETLINDVPMPQEALPPPDVNPLPLPEAPPAVEPQEGRIQNPQIRKVSKKRLRAAPTDNR